MIHSVRTDEICDAKRNRGGCCILLFDLLVHEIFLHLLRDHVDRALCRQDGEVRADRRRKRGRIACVWEAWFATVGRKDVIIISLVICEVEVLKTGR